MPVVQTEESATVGGFWQMSEEEGKVLQQFKELLQQEGMYNLDKHDDDLLLRFLRARQFDITQTKSMWIKNQNWRTSFKTEQIYASFEFPNEADGLPVFFHKTDKDGRPVYIEQLGKLDLISLCTDPVQEHQFLSLIVREFERFQRERAPACAGPSGQLIDTCCIIMNLEGVSLSQTWAAKGFIKKISDILSNNYPSTMGKLFIINAPWGFSTAWSVIKSFLDEATAAKISILGSSYQKALLEQVFPESLPAFLGGSCECAEGCATSDAGPWKGEKAMSKVMQRLDSGYGEVGKRV